MGKCTKMRCPMQVGTVDENCDIKDCPYRTDSDWLTKAVCEGLVKYFESTVEITKKIRLAKGDTCDCCAFKSFKRYPDCGGYVQCLLYGEKLQLKDDSLNSLICTITPPEERTYCKCEQCKVDTAEKL